MIGIDLLLPHHKTQYFFGHHGLLSMSRGSIKCSPVHDGSDHYILCWKCEFYSVKRGSEECAKWELCPLVPGRRRTI